MADEVAAEGKDPYPFRAFGKWVESKRRALGLNQYDMAERLHIAVYSLRNIETGYRKPSRDLMRVLAEVMGEKVPDPWVLRARPRRLPAPTTNLIGRDREVEAICSLFASATRLVSLVGPDGVGKSRLAIEVALRLDEQHSHGAWHVDLATEPPDRYCDAVLARFGIAQRAKRDPVVRLVEHLVDQETLVLLDNVAPTAPTADFVERMLAQAPDLKLLVTSPEPLGVYGEARYPVEPLAVPDDDAGATTEQLVATPAFRLFVERFRLGQPRFSLTPDAARAIAALCRQSGGLPLAIEVMAAAAASEADATAQPRPLSAAGAAGRLRPRPADTLLRAVDYTFGLLGATQQRLFARLGVFVGSFDVAGAAAVGDPNLSVDEVARACEGLVEMNLIVGSERGRFEVLSSIQSHMRRRLEPTGELAELERRHALHFASVAEQSFDGVHGREQVSWMRRLSADHANLAVAFEWALRNDPAVALSIAGSLWPYFSRCEALSDGRRWLNAALAAAGHDASPIRARAFIGAGVLARMQGEPPQASAHLEAGARMANLLGAKGLAALAQLHLGILAENAGQYLSADALFKQSLMVTGPDTSFIAALATNCRGMVCLDSSDLRGAAAFFTSSRELFEGREDGWGIALTAKNLAWTLAALNQPERARALYAESLVRYGEIGDERGLANTMASLGRLLLEDGQSEQAGELFADALATFHTIGERRGCGEVLFALALLAVRDGEPIRAACLLGAAAAVRAAIDSPLWGTEKSTHDDLIDRLRLELGADAYQAAWSEGYAMSFEASIHYALVP